MNQIYYANMINLNGLYSKFPIKVKQRKDLNLDGYCSQDGEFVANKLGIEKKDGHITICSINRADVLFWTEGIVNCIDMICYINGLNLNL